ncbi:small, acid-soluble spore protein K [Siminovitchia acidinfaciens]|uniref:Small, acid-soluble spore protein K n=1 Tax=Siminovitchia acidinfaciens TaxID=2321395 RepID=A0A429XVM1_9BACI|nr:small, acid-soluble spore protein K [Siminovitchia acidinfaciens]RST72314.1 small, acid-soluble spore protein K [Siminovitchia acidinfaciens]
MRNKAKDFPYGNTHRFEGEPRAKPEYGSKRPNGTTNTNPQERMRASGAREDERNQSL